MALWLVRAGGHGEHEARFMEDGRIYLTWEELTESDLSAIPDYNGIKQLLTKKYPGEPPRRIGNWCGQIWAFAEASSPEKPLQWLQQQLAQHLMSLADGDEAKAAKLAGLTPAKFRQLS